MKLKGILDIVNMLNEHTWTSTNSLVRELNVSVRTLRRYVREINEAFEPGIEVISGSDGYKLRTQDMVKVIRQNPESFKNLGAILVTPFGNLVNKPEHYPDYIMNVMKDAVQIRSSVNKEDLQHIFKAMRDGLYVIIRYNSSGAVKEHRCVPIRIYLDFSILYLNVYDEEKGHLITMAMTKIESVNLTRDKALSSLMEELREYLASAWGKMLRHDKKMISDAVFEADNFILPHFVNNPMHESQKIKREGGKNIVSLKTHHPVEFVRWSLRYGEDITVIGGEEVMTEMKRYIEMLNIKYCR